jgi:deaminated glutathione amidase
MLFLPECFGFLGSSVEQTILSAEDESTLTKPRKNPPQITEALARTVRHSAMSKGNAESNDLESPTVILSEAEDQNLALLDGLQTIAVESNLWISAGGMHILAPAVDSVDDPLADGVPQRVYNTHVIIDNLGVVRAHYAKIHLFDVCIPGQVDLRESKSTKPGTKLVVCPDSPIGTSQSLYRQYGSIHKAMLTTSRLIRLAFLCLVSGCLGVTVCYDLRFPEMYTQLVQSMGAHVLLVPSAFTVPTGRAHWHTLLRGKQAHCSNAS